MRALRAWRIVEELKLDESASARLFPILARYDEQEMALAAERRDIAQEIRTLLAAPQPDDAKLTAAINRMLANRAQAASRCSDERIKEVRKVLTPVQQAKLVLLLPRLEREFAQFIRDGGRRQPARRRPVARRVRDVRTCSRRRRPGRRRRRSRPRSWPPSRAPAAGGSRSRSRC